MVGILVLNWNNGADTIGCLRSLCRLEHPDFRIYIIDNGSTDYSVAEISRACAQTEVPYETRTAGHSPENSASRRASQARIIILLNHENLGYAGGNNVGIREALNDSCDAVWILNNDTEVAPDALRQLAETARIPKTGVIGACVVEFEKRDTVQSLGGARFNWVLTRNVVVGSGMPLRSVPNNPRDCPIIDYVAGASMFILAETIRQIGVLAEDFFYYYEELDYAERCRKAGLSCRVSPKAIVYHKFGATLGSSWLMSKKSSRSAYYGTRGAMLCVRKHRTMLLPIVALVRGGWVIALMLRGSVRLGWAAAVGLAHALTGRSGRAPAWLS